MKNRKCEVENCDKKYFAKGLCQLHYTRVRRNNCITTIKGTRKCTFEDCDEKHYAKGFCKKHWFLFNKHGDPSIKGDNSIRESHRFLENFLNSEHGEECEDWPFSLTDSGYGRIRINKKIYKIHRLVCLTFHGEPEGERIHVAHSCGRPKCINPNHLRWATPKENAQDKYIHGTDNVGSKHPMATINEEIVKEILNSEGASK
jgi:hypothetical protein